MGRFLFRRTPIGLTIAAWRLWRRLPPAQRRQLLRLVRRHGPRIAQAAAARRRRRL
jgi:hypothetical protein